ncbi:hypothetical protein DPMN_096863 [Dreissena polymorpha]|nr:hypothetical protein DPMN_096863 [Dreissena polymorpha]
MLDFIDERLKILLGIAASLGLKYAVTALMRRQRDELFELVGVVEELVCYPVKSCQGVNVQEAECTTEGLQVLGITDRHFMITRPNGRFMSQRQNPKMALISVLIKPEGVELQASGTSPLILPRLTSKSGHIVRQVNLWDIDREALDCGDEAAQWMSDFLGDEGLRVVCYTHDLKKSYYINAKKPWATRALETDATGFADWATYLFVTTSSVEALNTHLSKPVTSRNFRPNILISGTDAFEEDIWEEVLIGDSVRMRCLSACDRCLLTTVDPDKGERRPDGEPLTTLRKIRSIPPYSDYNECVFGVNAAPDVCGTVRVGDPVYAIKTRK